MFSGRRRLRRWAAQVLVVWLFGLAMGAANACALSERAHRRADAATAAAGQDGQKHRHGSAQGEAAEIDCLNFCEKSSIGAPPLKVVGDGLAALGFALPVSPQPTVGRPAVDSPNLRGGPPPRIVFQRLAL